ncbi:MAG: murein L,D-transpeptidase catalytic domain family protein [Alphaproteobacteria bacterium]|nr:murein L,D-transpeptidase catalytic domain family protein [Alphaproteobacteria bacterium]
MRHWILLALATLFTVHAGAVTVDGVALDPAGKIRRAILEQAVAVWRATPQARRDVLVVADFARPSIEPRFAIVDLKTGDVAAMRTAHGKGSDADHDGIPQTFSDTPGSNASATGAYLTGARYIGQHGLSLKLRGLDASNRNAESRAIVLHSAPYMTDAFIAAHGRPGRSWGCFVVAPTQVRAVVDRLEGGALIYAGR